MPRPNRSTGHAQAEALAYGGRARRILEGRWRPREQRLVLAVTLAALVVDAEDPKEARRLAWPWLGELVRGAA